MTNKEVSMRGLNSVTLVGHLGRDPELRTSSNGGTSWATFTLATGRARRDGEQWVEDTDWHRVKVFGSQAETCHKHLSKGSLVIVEGSISYESWQDKDGVKRQTTVILADRVTFTPPRRAAEPASAEVAEAHAEA
jgi:single-strand DNA-binding protein